MSFLIRFVLFITILQIINSRIVFDLQENTTPPTNYSEILKNIEKARENFRMQSVIEQYDSGEETVVLDNRHLFAVEENRTPTSAKVKICKKGFILIRKKCRRVFA